MVISAMIKKHQFNKKKGYKPLFNDFNLRNGPKSYQNYLHPNTLEDIFRVISNYSSTDR